MKPQHFAALAGFLLLAAVLLVVTGGPVVDRTGARDPNTSARVITVTGEGEVKVRPDTVLVTFGVTLHRASAVDAEKEALAAMTLIQTALAKAGAEEGRIELSSIQLTPDTYQDFSGTVRISGFQAKGTVQGVLRSIGRVQEALDAGLSAGATSVESVQYTLADAETSKQAAMKAALENARTRAAAMARAEGERLGSLQSMDVLLDATPGPATTPGGLLFRATVRATFDY
ncbi:MAG TPA: SIMPL domain-containing protein [Symbiobacteriaceae bacterium]|nr:SIMPL domain-containing protein [Symbiobacteriaceae bacterium]